MTNLAVVALRELESYDTAAKAKKNVRRAVEAVAITAFLDRRLAAG